VNVVARKPGVLAGSPIGRMVFAALDPSITWTAHKADGDVLAPGDVVATVAGSLGQLLVGERTMLNFLTHLSGIATLTRQFVDAVVGTSACILDTRKTLPGYRLLEKYAVRCGGGVNHRMGLYDGVLIKDNHLAAWTSQRKPRGPAPSVPPNTIAAAVRTAREKSPPGVSIEVEVDTLDQLRDALEGAPDIVLLDNMDAATLRQAVAIRDAFTKTKILLEASGGVTLATVRAIAETGVERISIGALTHSAPALDLAFDWANRVQ
jgi:nicotinate-nucleotide pyrophosphorylase (carboxylating)